MRGLEVEDAAKQGTWGWLRRPGRQGGALLGTRWRFRGTGATNLAKATNVLKQTLQVPIATHGRTVTNYGDMLPSSGDCHIHSPVVAQKAHHSYVV